MWLLILEIQHNLVKGIWVLDLDFKIYTKVHPLIAVSWTSCLNSLSFSLFTYAIAISRITNASRHKVIVSEEVLVAQSCPTLCDPMDCSPPGSSVHEIFQARILEWVAISFCRGFSQLRDRTQVSCTAGRFFTHWATREAPAKPQGNLPYREFQKF